MDAATLKFKVLLGHTVTYEKETNKQSGYKLNVGNYSVDEIARTYTVFYIV